MNHTDQQPNTKTPSAGRPRSAVDGPPFPPSCAVPVEPESKFLFNADDFEDDGGSSSNAKRRSMSTSFHPPALPLDDGGPLTLQAPFRPLSRGLFEKDRHPLSTSNVFPPSFSVQSLRDLVISYVFDGDFFLPLKILPFTEYSPGDMMSLVLTDNQMKFHPRLDQFTLLRSLHDCVLFTPPPLYVRTEHGLEFGPNAKLRALPSAYFENLNVLHVVLCSIFEPFCVVLAQLKGLLKHVKILIVQLKKREHKSGLNDELFVFDLRNTTDIVSAVANILATVSAYDILNDVEELFAVYAVGNEQQVVLMEAVIIVDDERFPAIKHLLDHPSCRWIFHLKSPYLVPSVAELSKAHYILSSWEDDANITGPKTAIREYDQLTSWSYSDELPPVDGFVHRRLSNLRWSPGSYNRDFAGFSGIPNLQRLKMRSYSQSTPVLRLDETKRLKHLELQNLEGWEVDVGPDRVSLDVLHLNHFKGKMTRIEHLFIRDVEIKSSIQPKLVHQLCLQAENVRFEIDKYTPSEQDWSYAFAHAKHLRCGRPNETFVLDYVAYSFFLIATDAFSRLQSLELDNSKLLLSPSLFPVLRKLILDTCHVLVPSNADEESKEEQPRLHFEDLEECALKYCRIDRADSDEAKLKKPKNVNHLKRIQYAFRAPNLKLLSYCQIDGSVALFLDEASCPRLGSFEWSGRDFAELPFEMNVSLDRALFPKLHSLSLCVTQMKLYTKLPFSWLSRRLSIKSVSLLSLLDYAYVIGLADLRLQCRWAHFSDIVVSEYFGDYPMDGIMDGDVYLAGAGVPMMKKMPQIELLMFEEVYVYPHTAPIEANCFLLSDEEENVDCE